VMRHLQAHPGTPHAEIAASFVEVCMDVLSTSAARWRRTPRRHWSSSGCGREPTAARGAAELCAELGVELCLPLCAGPPTSGRWSRCPPGTTSTPAGSRCWSRRRRWASPSSDGLARFGPGWFGIRHCGRD
jgi:hypothetical protein